MRNIAVVSVSRSDYSYLRPVMRLLRAGGRVNVQLIVAAGHLVRNMGDTIADILADTLPVAATIPMTLATDDARSIASSIALGIVRFADCYESLRPDIVVLLGDRYETLAAATASLPAGIVIAHIAGGESSEGAMDEQIRHAITKMAHLHFVSTALYRNRLLQMGENPAHVYLTGAPSIDVAAGVPEIPRGVLEFRFGIVLDPAPLLVTYHPATRDPLPPEAQVSALLAALRAANRPVIFTEPNADPGGSVIRDQLEAFVASDDRHRLVRNFGTDAYFNLLRYVSMMVGNSSSGIIEAATFGLPVVNVGSRQNGRVRGENVVDCAGEPEAILAAMQQADSPDFRARCRGMINPYGAPGSVAEIARVLSTICIDDQLRCKRFADALPGVVATSAGDWGAR